MAFFLLMLLLFISALLFRSMFFFLGERDKITNHSRPETFCSVSRTESGPVIDRYIYMYKKWKCVGNIKGSYINAIFLLRTQTDGIFRIYWFFLYSSLSHTIRMSSPQTEPCRCSLISLAKMFFDIERLLLQ